jgi:hypothetical protein
VVAEESSRQLAYGLRLVCRGATQAHAVKGAWPPCLGQSPDHCSSSRSCTGNILNVSENGGKGLHKSWPGLASPGCPWVPMQPIG